jgi:ankyrin repeat protein
MSSNPATVALADAVKLGDLAGVHAALHDGADMKQADEEGRTALWYSAQHGQSDIAAMLLEAGSNVDHSDNLGGTALTCAARNGHLPVVKLLLQHGCNLEALDLMPVHIA